MKAPTAAEIAAYPIKPQIVFILSKSPRIGGSRETIAFFQSRHEAAQAALILALANKAYWFRVKPEREVAA